MMMKMNTQVVLLLTILQMSQAAEWQLVWLDEFDGQQLNNSEWDYDVGCTGWGNQELQCYTANRPENVRLQNGRLVIDVRVEQYQGHNFTSGRIKTKRAWAFGKFEARVRLPAGHQLWPAFWMLPKHNKYGGWAASGEIDIMEYRGDYTNQSCGTIHYGGSWPHNMYSGSGDKQFAGVDFSKDFHTFAVEWEKKQIRWYLDGKQFHAENIDRNMWSGRGTNPYTANGQPFDGSNEFQLLLNVAVGGTFFGPPPYVSVDQAKAWPKHIMEVDYVRVYQLK